MIIPRFDRQQSCVFSESFESIYDLRQRGIVSSAPTLSDGPTGRSAATFEGTDDKVVFVGRYSVKSAVGWVYLATITEQIVDFDGGSHYIHVSGGTVTATGWSTPTVYVDGAATTTIAAAGWHHIAVTTATAFAATNLQFATDNSAFGAVRLYGWTLWDRALSAAEVLSIYNRTVWDYDLYEVSHWDKIGRAHV